MMSGIVSELSPLVGLKVIKVEVVSICHILRLYFDNGMLMDLPGSWRYRSDKSTILGAMDIDFYSEMDEDYLDEEDKVYSKKASSLVGKKITKIHAQQNDIFFELSGKRYIDLFNLQSEGLAILVKSDD